MSVFFLARRPVAMDPVCFHTGSSSESELKLPLAMVALASHPSFLLQERKLLRWKVEKGQEGSILYAFDAIVV